MPLSTLRCVWFRGYGDPVRVEKLPAERHLRHEHKVTCSPLCCHYFDAYPFKTLPVFCFLPALKSTE